MDDQGAEELRRAVERLPPTYGLAWSLRAAGATDEVIAIALGIDPVSVPPLLDLAEAKLAAIRRLALPEVPSDHPEPRR